MAPAGPCARHASVRLRAAERCAQEGLPGSEGLTGSRRRTDGTGTGTGSGRWPISGSEGPLSGSLPFRLRETYGETQLPASDALQGRVGKTTSMVIRCARGWRSNREERHARPCAALLLREAGRVKLTSALACGLPARSIYRQRLAAAHHAAPSETDKENPMPEAGPAAEPRSAGDGARNTSFFDLVSQLHRSEAVKLFYQTLVSQTLGYVRASQAEPYGDITVRPGAAMAL
jgi:hypothetical protein